jgi:hypothetical protein
MSITVLSESHKGKRVLSEAGVEFGSRPGVLTVRIKWRDGRRSKTLVIEISGAELRYEVLSDAHKAFATKPLRKLR